MAKVALLVGVSEYQPGLRPLVQASQDVEAMQRVLQMSELNGFDQIKPLINPDPQTLRVEIESLFSGRAKEDLVLLFFSGHGIKDDQGNLYLSTRDTRKTISGELIRATAVEASFVRSLMSNSRCKRQVVILDCCYSGAFASGMAAKDSGRVDIETQLGGEGRAVLTSSSSTQYSFEESEADLSIYTRYLVEGLETGAADLDHDGWIALEELHEYAKAKVQETAPAMKPEIYTAQEGFKIHLTRARIGDPKLRYRQEMERYSDRGEIVGVGRIILKTLQERLGLSSEEVAQIEDEVMRPYQERLENVQRYREAVLVAVESGDSFSEQTRDDLKHLRDILGLRDEDTISIETQFMHPVESNEKTSQISTPALSSFPSAVSPQYHVEASAQLESVPSLSKPVRVRQLLVKSKSWLQWVMVNSVGIAVGGAVGGAVAEIVAEIVGWVVLTPVGLTVVGAFVSAVVGIAVGGAVVGAVLGLIQWFWLRDKILNSHLSNAVGWIVRTAVASIAGIAVTFTVGGAIGGAVFGLIQWFWLRNKILNSHNSVSMAVIWSVGGAIGEIVSGVVGGIVGGAVYGAITGRALVRSLKLSGVTRPVD